MKSFAELITDAKVDEVHAYAQFGSMSKRAVIAEGVMKSAVGLHCGSTMQRIIYEHKLTRRLGGGLTPKGRKVLRCLVLENWVSFSDQEAAR